VDDGGTAFIIFLLGDPHLLEGGEGSQDGSTDPYGVLSLRRSNDLNLDGGRSEGGDFLLHSVSNTRVHGGASGHDGVSIEILTDVNITLHDGVVGGLMDTARFHSKEGRLEEGFRGTESFIADGDNLAVGKFIGLLKGSGGSGSSHFLFEVKGNIAELFLDVSDNFTFSSGGERVASLSEDLHEVVGEFTSSQVKTKDSMGEGITFIDGNSVRDTITRIHDNTGGTTGSIEGKDSLDGDIHGGHVEGLKHDLSHLFSVSLGVKRSFSQEDGLFLRGNSKFIVEGVMPDLFHIVPVGNDTMFNWVFQGEDTSLGLSFITNIGILLSHTYHDTLVTRATDDGGEDGTGSVISCEAGFAHTGTIVNDQSGNVFVTHFEILDLRRI